LIRKGQGRPPADYYVDVLFCAYQTNNYKYFLIYGQ